MPRSLSRSVPGADHGACPEACPGAGPVVHLALLHVPVPTSSRVSPPRLPRRLSVPRASFPPSSSARIAPLLHRSRVCASLGLFPSSAARAALLPSTPAADGSLLAKRSTRPCHPLFNAAGAGDAERRGPGDSLALAALRRQAGTGEAGSRERRAGIRRATRAATRRRQGEGGARTLERNDTIQGQRSAAWSRNAETMPRKLLGARAERKRAPRAARLYSSLCSCSRPSRVRGL